MAKKTIDKVEVWVAEKSMRIIYHNVANVTVTPCQSDDLLVVHYLMNERECVAVYPLTKVIRYTIHHALEKQETVTESKAEEPVCT